MTANEDGLDGVDPAPRGKSWSAIVEWVRNRPIAAGVIAALAIIAIAVAVESESESTVVEPKAVVPGQTILDWADVTGSGSGMAWDFSGKT